MQILKKTKLIALSTLMVLGLFPSSVLAQEGSVEPTPVVETVENNDVLEGEEPIVTVTPEQPVETIEPIETENPIESEQPIESLTPNNTEIPEEEPISTEVPLMTIEPIESTNVEMDNLVEEEVIKDELMTVTALDLVYLIQSNANIVAIIGNENDEVVKQIEEGFAKRVASKNEITDYVFAITSKDSLEGAKEALYKLCVDDTDKQNLEKALNDIEFDQTGNSVIVKSYNGEISKIKQNSLGISENLTWQDVARFEVNSWMNKLLNQSGPEIMLMANHETEIGKTWEYKSKNRIQTFTAPEMGDYRIKLWAADGDSDTGWFASGESGKYMKATYGIGGSGAYTEGIVHLEEGQTIYLALGPRNDYSEKKSYNGGGLGHGAWIQYRAGGGGAASVYLSEHGNGEIKDYENYKDDILMIAGGGGGAEDFYTSSYGPSYCYVNRCEHSVGGHGGENPTDGTSSGPLGKGGGYQFGVGEDYGSWENSSSGGGGGGYYGGSAANDNNMLLRGGTGGGGSSYINTNYVSEGKMEQGELVTISEDYEDGEFNLMDDGEDSKAEIEFVGYKKFKLTINYKDVYTKESIATSYEEYIPYGDQYSVDSPKVSGYTPVDMEQNIVKGVMPAQDVVIDVYYDYPAVRVHYLEYGTNTVLHERYEVRLKLGEQYYAESPKIDGYVFFESDEQSKVVKGIKEIDDDEDFYIYYVKEFTPTKHIVEVNGQTISQESSDKGVQLKENDIVTYEIRFENLRNVVVQENIEDLLPNTLELKEIIWDEEMNEGVVINFDKNNPLIAYATIQAQTSGSFRFSAVVKHIDGTQTIDNWNRKDPYIQYEVVKDADPKPNSNVSYNQEVEYTLNVKNSGYNTINNIVVVDYIPENSELVTVNHDYKGDSYELDGKTYVRYQIDLLQPGEVARLKFTVKVTVRLQGEETAKLVNIAKFDNFNEVDDIYEDNEILENGHSSNEVVHPIVGIQLSAVKSANPTHGTKVQAGQEIEYVIDLNNDTDTSDGNMGANSSTNIRIMDEIPAGTRFVEGSLSMVSDNQESNNKYAVSVGDGFTIGYDFKTNQYYLSNPKIDNTVHQITIEWPDTIKIDENSINGIGTITGNTLVYSKYSDLGTVSNPVSFTNSELKSYLENLRWNGDYAQNLVGAIKVTYATLKIDNLGADISSASKNWTRLNDTGTWYSDSSRIWNTQNTDHPTGFYNPGKNYAQLNFSVDITALTSGDDDYLGILFKTKPNSTTGNTSSYVFAFPKNMSGKPFGGLGYPGLYYIENGNFANDGHFHLIKAASPSIYWVANQYKTVKVVTSGDKGDHIQIFIDGTKVIDIVDERFSSGSVGFWTYSQEQASFRNIVGSAGYYETTNNNSYTTALPTPSSSGGCKYITTNGNPYVECVTDGLESGQHAQMKFKVMVDSELSKNLTTINNVALYENSFNDYGFAGSVTTKPTKQTNETIHPLKDLTVNAIKSSNPISGENVNILSDIEYTLSFTNTGTGTIPYLVVEDKIPANTQYVINSANEQGVYIGNKVQWVIEDLTAGSTKELKFKVEVTGYDGLDTEIVNYANYEIFHENPGNVGEVEKALNRKTNETVHTIINIDKPVTPGKPNVSSLKSSTPIENSYINRNTDIQYCLQFTNDTEVKVPNLYVKDMIPEGTTFKSFDKVEGGENSPQLMVSNFLAEDGSYIEYEVKNLVGKDTIKLFFTVTVDKETLLTQIQNQAKYFISTKVNGVLGSRDDSLFTEETNIVNHYLNEPIIEANKYANPESGSVVGRGRQITYYIDVTNESETPANYVTVNDIVPDEVEIDENTILTSVKGDKGTYHEESNSVRFVLFDMQPHETRTVEFTVNVKDDVRQGDYIYNSATYGTSIISPGDPKTDDFKVPDEPTNTTVHTVDFGADIIPTGGQGWNNTLLISGSSFVVCALIIAYTLIKKKKGEISD